MARNKIRDLNGQLQMLDSKVGAAVQTYNTSSSVESTTIDQPPNSRSTTPQNTFDGYDDIPFDDIPF